MTPMFIGVIALGCVFVLMVMVVAYLFRSRWLHHAEIKARQTCSAELCTKLAGLDELVMRSMMTDLHKSFPPLEEVRHAFTNIGCGIESCFTPESLDQVILLVLRGFDQDFVFQGAESPAATDGIQLDVASIPSAVTLRRSLGGAAVLDSYVTAQVSCLLRHVDTILQNCATSLATADGNEDELPSSACRRVCCLCGADEAYYAHTQNAFAENFARVGTSEATLRHCESAGFFGGGAAGGAPQPAADAQPPVALPIRDCHFAWEEKVEYDVIFAGSDGLRNRVAARLDVLRVAYWKSMSTKKLAYTMFEGLVVADRHAKIWHRAVVEWVYGMFLKVAAAHHAARSTPEELESARKRATDMAIPMLSEFAQGMTLLKIAHAASRDICALGKQLAGAFAANSKTNLEAALERQRQTLQQLASKAKFTNWLPLEEMLLSFNYYAKVVRANPLKVVFAAPLGAGSISKRKISDAPGKGEEGQPSPAQAS